MDWLDNMQRALDYIEENLKGELDIEAIARIAYSSSFHFQRMFHMITGFTVADYIRKRRLTLSAQELAAGGSKVIDAAMKYGYETPESFAKAFKKVHGISPAAARVHGASLKAFPKISFHISITGEKDMDYKIIEKEAFELAGKAIRVTTKDGHNFKQVSKFWEDSRKDGTMEKICEHVGASGVFGVCLDFEEHLEEFTYMIGIEREGDIPADFALIQVPAATWAVFTSVGALPEAIQEVTRRIFSEWFPATGYIHDNAPELEVYPEGDTVSPDYRCEVWIPVKKK
jgi:AraC family transcriptional regulator